MTRNRLRSKGRRDSGSFVALPHELLNSAAFTYLTPKATKLLLDIAAQYKGRNNGDLCASWQVMRKRGWNSRTTVDRAEKELLEHGLIELTRQGGKHMPTLYAITWRAIDDCETRLDVSSTKTASNLWRVWVPPSISDAHDLRQSDPRNGLIQHQHGKNGTQLAHHVGLSDT